MHVPIAFRGLGTNSARTETSRCGLRWRVDVLTAIPLRATWSMLLIGFSGLGFVAYRGSRRWAAAFAAA
jgi:hypothetical protein